jgi:hypothetical protein
VDPLGPFARPSSRSAYKHSRSLLRSRLALGRTLSRTSVCAPVHTPVHAFGRTVVRLLTSTRSARARRCSRRALVNVLGARPSPCLVRSPQRSQRAHGPPAGLHTCRRARHAPLHALYGHPSACSAALTVVVGRPSPLPLRFTNKRLVARLSVFGVRRGLRCQFRRRVLDICKFIFHPTVRH